MIRVVFMGSAELACSSLRALAGDPRIDVMAAVVQPDRPAGRGRKVLPCHVKIVAQDLGVQVLTPENVNSPDSLAVLSGMHPDLIAVVAYGQILKPAILQTPPMGCVNLHASLLPKYRGAAPIQWAIARGESITGVTSMYINERMDAGDMIQQRAMPVADDDTAESMHDKLAKLGAEVLLGTINDIMDGETTRIPQVEADASYAPKLKKDDGLINWSMSAAEIFNRVRGFYPWPCCWCYVPAGREHGNKQVSDPVVIKVLKVAVEASDAGVAGEVLDINSDGPLIRTSDMAVRLLEVKPEGGKTMSGKAYTCGHDLKVGARL